MLLKLICACISNSFCIQMVLIQAELYFKCFLEFMLIKPIISS